MTDIDSSKSKVLKFRSPNNAKVGIELTLDSINSISGKLFVGFISNLVFKN